MFFRAFSSVVRQIIGYNSLRRGTTRIPNFLIIGIYVSFSVLCVLFCVNVYCTAATECQTIRIINNKVIMLSSTNPLCYSRNVLLLVSVYQMYGGTGKRICLRHYATSQEVAGSITDVVTGIFRWRNPSGRAMALGSTQPLTRNEYQELGGGGSKGGRCVGLTSFLPSCVDCREIWELKRAGTLRACPGLYRDCCTFTLSGMYVAFD
jgi:hypothetical protein